MLIDCITNHKILVVTVVIALTVVVVVVVNTIVRLYFDEQAMCKKVYLSNFRSKSFDWLLVRAFSHGCEFRLTFHFYCIWTCTQTSQKCLFYSITTKSPLLFLPKFIFICRFHMWCDIFQHKTVLIAYTCFLCGKTRIICQWLNLDCLVFSSCSSSNPFPLIRIPIGQIIDFPLNLKKILPL